MKHHELPRIPERTDTLRTVYKVVSAKRRAARSKHYVLSSMSARLDGYTRTYEPGKWMDFPHPAFVLDCKGRAVLLGGSEPGSQVWECETHTEPYYPSFASARWMDIPEFWQRVTDMQIGGIGSYEWTGWRTFYGMEVTPVHIGTQWVTDLRLVERIH